MKEYTIKIPDFKGQASIDYKKHLNPEQYTVVTEAEGPVLVLAGAGTGKTRTLVYRVAYLLEKGVKPQNLLLVTFTNKAAREMTSRVEHLLGAKPRGFASGTFHHVGNICLRKFADHLGFTKDFGILDEEDSRSLIKSCMDSLNIKTSQRRFPKAAVVQSIISFATNSKRPLEEVVAQRYPYFLEASSDIEKIAKLYKNRKFSSNNMDYDDLLTKWIELLKGNRDASRKYQEQFRYILVDEYQDTNRLQHEIINILAEFHRNILVVGDDAQSIYSFRAADIQNILEFPKLYPDARIFKLQTNYRSTPQILNLANLSIANNKDQYQKQLKSVVEDGEKPALVQLKSIESQSAFIAQRILEMRDEGTPLKDMAALFRARYQAAELELELVKRGIPYVLRGGVRFFEQAHIKDVMAYLRVNINPKDEISWKRILCLQTGIGKAMSEQIWQKIQACEFSTQKILSNSFKKDLPKRTHRGWDELMRLLKTLNSAENKDAPTKQIENIIKSGYDKYIITAFEDAQDRLDDLEELANFAYTHDSVESFLSEVTLREDFKGETVKGHKPTEDEYFVLSTIHQAKGLEWHAVFLMGACEGQFPHPKSLDDNVQLEEERRLFYVASTRAKKQLYITHPILRYDHNWGEIITRPSIFVQELPQSAYENWHTFSEAEEVGIEEI